MCYEIGSNEKCLCPNVKPEPREEPLNRVQNLQIFLETDLTKPQVTIVLCRQQCIYLYTSISHTIYVKNNSLC